MNVIDPPASPAPSARQLARRIALLVGCLALGGVIGFVGERLTGDAAWFLAIPVCMAVGWFAVADPTSCIPAGDGRRSGRPLLW